MTKYFLFLFLFSFQYVFTQNDLNFLHKKAEFHWIDRDYSEAKNIYESIQIQELKPWQKARLDYNLGLIELYKNCPLQALNSFQKIDLSDFLDLKFIRDYFCGLTVANLLQGKENCVSVKEFSAPIQTFLIQKSDQLLSEAILIDEVIQKKELREKFKRYKPSSLIEETQNFWLRFEIENKMRTQEEWLAQAKIEEIVFLLWFSVTEILNQANDILANKMANDPDLNQFSNYFQNEFKKTFFLKKKIEEILLEMDQKKQLNDFTKIFKNSKNLNFDTFILQLKKLKTDVESLDFFPSNSAELFYFSYNIFLLNETLTSNDVGRLLDSLSNLEIIKKDSFLIEHTQENLFLSQKALIANNQNEALFYLWNGSNFESLIFSENLTPLNILSQLINQVKRGFKLFSFWELGSKEFRASPKTIESLINQQKLILNRSKQFLPSIIEFQKKAYESKENIYFDWEKIIDLFGRGFRLINQNLTLFSRSLSGEKILNNQVETIQLWTRALELLSSPSQTPFDKENFSFDSNIQENFQMIQEMYLQDQSSKREELKEMYTW